MPPKEGGLESEISEFLLFIGKYKLSGSEAPELEGFGEASLQGI